MSDNRDTIKEDNKNKDIDKFLGPKKYSMSDLNSVYTHYNQETHRNEPTPNHI